MLRKPQLRTFFIGVALLGLGALLSAAGLTADQAAAARTLVTKKCSGCHSLGKARLSFAVTQQFDGGGRMPPKRSHGAAPWIPARRMSKSTSLSNAWA